MTKLASLLAAATLTCGSALALAAPAAASTPACGNSAIGIHATGTQGATGHGSLTLRFQNVSSHTCTIHGYPGVDALDSHGHVLAHAGRSLSGFAGGSTIGVPTVVVHPGGWASATLEWHNFNFRTGGSCRFSASIAVTPANTSHTVVRTRSVSVCHLQVHPTVAGITGDA